MLQWITMIQFKVEMKILCNWKPPFLCLCVKFNIGNIGHKNIILNVFFLLPSKIKKLFNKCNRIFNVPWNFNWYIFVMKNTDYCFIYVQKYQHWKIRIMMYYTKRKCSWLHLFHPIQIKSEHFLFEFSNKFFELVV